MSAVRASALPRTVWALGLTSLWMDVASDSIHGLLPVFLTVTLGASMASYGLVVGIGDAVALVGRAVAGPLADRMTRRKPLAVLGYGLSAASKPLFGLVGSVGGVAVVHLLDRGGKGLREAPRDALLADIVPADRRGAAYGLRQSMDTTGAILGPLLGAAVVAWSGDVRTVFKVALIPAALSVLSLVLLVDEPPRATVVRPAWRPWAELRALPPAFRRVLGFGVCLGFARLGEGFVLLRGASLGLTAAQLPLLLALMNVVGAAVAFPVGRLSDRIGRRVVLVGGLVALVVADVLLARAASAAMGVVGAALWGLHMGLVQPVTAAWVADTAPATQRGTAFGLFSVVSGAVTLLASALAGVLWDGFGAGAAFAVAGAAAAVATGLAWGWSNDRQEA